MIPLSSSTSIGSTWCNCDLMLRVMKWSSGISFLDSSVASGQSSLPTNFYTMHHWMKQIHTSLCKHFEGNCQTWFSMLATHPILPQEILLSCLSFFFQRIPTILLHKNACLEEATLCWKILSLLVHFQQWTLLRMEILHINQCSFFYPH